MGHVPSGESTELKILSFEAAQNSSSNDDKEWLYIPDFYSDYRYILGKVGKNPLITIGINPSTAEPDKLDRTLQKVENIAIGNGYDSFIMFNVYAQRATKPKDLTAVWNAPGMRSVSTTEATPSAVWTNSLPFTKG